MTSKHPLHTQRAKMAALEKFFATLAKALGFTGTDFELDAFVSVPSFPKPYYMTDLSLDAVPATIVFDKPKHGTVFHALGRNQWKRKLSPKGDFFDFWQEVDGVIVELADAQKNNTVPLFIPEVDVDFFPEAALPTHKVEEVGA